MKRQPLPFGFGTPIPWIAINCNAVKIAETQEVEAARSAPLPNTSLPPNSPMVQGVAGNPYLWVFKIMPLNNRFGKNMFGLGKTSKRNFIFVFVNECERVSFIKK